MWVLLRILHPAADQTLGMAETIQRLGTKLFTRIKAEDEQAVIRRFLAQGS